MGFSMEVWVFYDLPFVGGFVLSQQENGRKKCLNVMNFCLFD